jgi:hypothetical protein
MSCANANQAISLKDTVGILKGEVVAKENLVISLEAEANEHMLQIQDLRNQIQANQKRTNVNLQDKVELENNVEALRREVNQQQNRITELISINEELITFSQSNEDEVGWLLTVHIFSVETCQSAYKHFMKNPERNLLSV